MFGYFLISIDKIANPLCCQYIVMLPIREKKNINVVLKFLI